jgi:hypothetical protein
VGLGVIFSVAYSHPRWRWKERPLYLRFVHAFSEQATHIVAVSGARQQRRSQGCADQIARARDGAPRAGRLRVHRPPPHTSPINMFLEYD